MPTEQKNISLPSSAALFKEAFVIYKKRFGVFTAILLLPALVNAIYSSVDETKIVILFMLGIVSLLLGIWVQPSLLYAIKDSQEGIGVSESYRRGWHKIISFGWVAFLVGIVVFLGLMLFIVPGIIFALWFGFSLVILIAEDLHGTKALSKSREYVRGKLFDVTVKFLFLFFVLLVLSLIIKFVLAILNIPFGDQLFSFITNLFLSPLSMVYFFQLYLKLKELKESVIQMPVATEGQVRS